MIVLVLSAVPPGLRGITTRWLQEVTPGVFVGRLSARVRELLWERIIQHVGEGSALMIWRTVSEQGFAYRQLNYAWKPTDFDGISLLARAQAPAEAIKVRERLEV